ncbi:MAG: RNA polymerase-associated protein RapA [Chromatiaceae bacterium]|nr:RNA polymerase-associated protein RapA [Chromatiaceae bacterium]MCP5421316.1 RNA polymerase-associated protein RapA [Chromatiaceae bacterium]
MQQRFVAGQRWISEAEPDLGLGIVEAVDGRQVRVLFAGAGEARTYASGNAPLGRALFAIDDRIEDRQGNPLTVTQLEPVGDLVRYHCVDAGGRQVELPEQLLSDHLRLNRPQDKLLARRIDPDVWFTLRYRAWLQTAALWGSPVFGLGGPRIDLIPHQLYIAAEVASRASPRVLLADEVGLGKTIEAGLILHRLLLTGRVDRVLVVVPDALVNQWLVEMLRRFNLRFAVFDAERFAESDAANPFHSEQCVLCSLPLLTGDAAVARAAIDGDWDLLIVDEAHHLEWTEQGGSLAYQLVEALAARTGSVLLLTATPEQLGRAGHFGRLRLLDPQRFHDYAAFVAEEEAYADVAAVAATLLDGRDPGERARRLLAQLMGDGADLGREQVIARLIDRHGTGRVLFRNTRHAIKGFPERRLHSYPLPLPTIYSTLRADPTPESTVGAAWVAEDPRVDWLRDMLRTLAPDKVLVICAHADTTIALRDHLLERCAIHAAMFHERMEIVARDRAAAFFADPDEGSQVLICSEIGSEGRNFQFAHHLVLFDLPLDPDVLEQRIGRLDRIGQREAISLHVPYLEGAASEVLWRWYRDGLGSFEKVCPAASAVYSAMRERLATTLAGGDGVDALVANAAAMTTRINAQLESGRDRLLELHSHSPESAAQLVAELRGQHEVTALPPFIYAYWDAFGLEHEPGPGHAVILRPGTHMLNDHYPGLGSEPVTLTFDRGDALAHEDRQFLTWEHPMVRGSIDLLTSGELGAAAVTVCSHPDFRAGSVLLELLYVVECSAPRGLELQRYLPPTCVRYLLDANGDDRAASLPHDVLQGLCLVHNRKLVDTVIKSQAERIKLMLQHGDGLAGQAGIKIAATARARMDGELAAEQQRLAALARVNPNVRQDEIEQLILRRERIAVHLDDTRVRLDAMRIVVMR